MSAPILRVASPRQSRLALLAALAVLAGSVAACGSPMRDALRDQDDAARVPDGFELVYDDHSPHFGGQRITVRGDGAVWVQRYSPGLGGAETSTREAGRIEEARVLRLVEVLLEVEAWEQGVASLSEPLNDARATLDIRTASGSSSIWEWVEDLEEHDRIIRVKRELMGIAGDMVPNAPPTPPEGATPDDTAGGDAGDTTDGTEGTDDGQRRPRITGRGIVR